ncbi:MAG: hypothetical protein AB7V62_10555 [Thermoleophilia bacterium]
MRRGGPPMLPLDPAHIPPFSRLERGARGLRFAATGAPADASATPGAPLRAVAGAPAVVHRATVVAEGRLVLASGPGVAFSIATPRMHVIHDRRPPGLDAAAGAAGANAGLLHADDGWRAVVLPSLGDIAAGLGKGPVAIRADGRRLALLDGHAVEEHDLGTDGPVASHPGPAEALAYDASGELVVAAGGRVGRPGLAPGDGSPVIALAAASAAPRVAALHADGTVSVFEPGADEPLYVWASPVADAGAIALTADGALVALGTPTADEPVAALADARDGAQVRRVVGARALAPAPEPDVFAVAGDWGCAWLTPPEEER